ncbi:hypothetical protein AB0D42_39015 [Streptomyces sp. NPDC048304]
MDDGAGGDTRGSSAVAALLFPRTGALGVVALRVTIAAVLLLAVCLPDAR